VQPPGRQSASNYRQGRRYEATQGEWLVERLVKEFHHPGRAGGGGLYTARCLHENGLTTAHDANTGSIFVIPAWAGGAMPFICTMGIDNSLLRTDDLAQRHGAGLSVSEAVCETIRRHPPSYRMVCQRTKLPRHGRQHA